MIERWFHDKRSQAHVCAWTWYENNMSRTNTDIFSRSDRPDLPPTASLEPSSLLPAHDCTQTRNPWYLGKTRGADPLSWHPQTRERSNRYYLCTLLSRQQCGCDTVLQRVSRRSCFPCFATPQGRAIVTHYCCQSLYCSRCCYWRRLLETNRESPSSLRAEPQSFYRTCLEFSS